MNIFEQLQAKKVARAKELLSKLLGARERLAAAEELKKYDIVRNWLEVYASYLKELKEWVNGQKTLCPQGTNCHSLLQEEINDLGDAVAHLNRVAQGAETLNQVKISKVLIMIASREHSLIELLKKSEEYKAAA